MAGSTEELRLPVARFGELVRELRPGPRNIPLFRSSMGDRMPPPFKMHMDTWFQDISSGCLRLLLICNSSRNLHSLFWAFFLRVRSQK